MKIRVLIILLMITSLVVAGVVVNKNRSDNEQIRSVNLSTDYEIEQVLKDIELLKVNTVNVPVAIAIPNKTSNELTVIDYSEQRAIELIKILNKKGIKVILEPFPWINEGSEYETAYEPLDIDLFFKDWQTILTYLINKIATPYNVDAIIVGSNLTLLEKYEQQWCDLIDDVKSRFNGLVTYKTSWWYTAQWDETQAQTYEAKLNNKLFSSVDFISIASYFELSELRVNTVDELVAALKSTTIHDRQQNIEEEISNFSKKHNKKIYFGELGFPRRDYAALQPWNSHVSTVENNLEQARCFEAYRRVFSDKDYFLGYSVFAVGQTGDDKAFYPSAESIKVISNWNEPTNK